MGRQAGDVADQVAEQRQAEQPRRAEREERPQPPEQVVPEDKIAELNSMLKAVVK